MTDKIKPDVQEEHDRSADRGNGADADSGTTPAAAEDILAATGRTASRPKQPLITAIEIENFKGIGALVRIDLRPITLLFGRNSAGKSTILQALCYAHEILSHRNVDVHKTELGGDQIDLGGFRQFVHGHDPNRAVRLRFELNLESWRVPAPLMERMQRSEHVEPELAGEFEDWVEANDPAKHAESGWMELSIMPNEFGRKPMLYSYELGINDKLVGRIRRNDRSDSSRMILVFNWTHPLFDGLRENERAPMQSAAANVSDTPDSELEEWHFHHTDVYGGSKSPLPDWDDLLYVDGDNLEYDDYIDVSGWGSTSYPRFQALITGVLAGVGRSLRDELATLRYLGPVRELRPRTALDADPHYQGNWSDGSAAWSLLARNSPHAALGGDLLQDVNEWLKRADRLDTGYELRRKLTIELPADKPPISLIRLYEDLPARYRDENGVVDLDRWVQQQAEALTLSVGSALYRANQKDVEARIKTPRNPGSDSTGTSATGGRDIEVRRELYETLLGVVTAIHELKKGIPPSSVEALVKTIAEAPQRTTLQLVTAEAELPVRTSDIGVGISQILPVVAAALDPHRPGITAIEQPELHVHPRMQVELGDLFAAALDHSVSGFNAQSDRPDQPAGIFLIETHSEHLILRLLRRIEETHSGELPEGKPALQPDQVSVVFLEQCDGRVRTTPLRIDETGEFVDRWPQGFFEERSDELFY